MNYVSDYNFHTITVVETDFGIAKKDIFADVIHLSLITTHKNNSFSKENYNY